MQRKGKYCSNSDLANSNRMVVDINMGAVHSIGNSDLEACPNHVMTSLDSRIVGRMSDEVVLSHSFEIMSDILYVSSDVDSQRLLSSPGLSRDNLQRSSG